MLADPLIKGWSGSSLEAAARVEAVGFDRSIAGDDRERLSATLNFRHRPWVVLRAGWYYEVRHDRFANPTSSAGISLTASSYF